MSDNRLWLFNPITDTTIYLAKYYQATGWHVVPTADKICDAFNASAYAHLSDEERKTIDRRSKTGPPYAIGSRYGDDWVLKYEYVTEKEKKHQHECIHCQSEAVIDSFSHPLRPVEYFLRCINPQCQARGPWRRTEQEAVAAYQRNP